MVSYLYGFGNHHESEALPGALPVGQNSPQTCPYGLYAEQVNGTAFTAPRATNLRCWLYRKRPSVCHRPFREYPKYSPDEERLTFTPNQLRWSPLELDDDKVKVDFVDGLRRVAGAGSPQERDGLNVYLYACNTAMDRKAFYNSDGDFLIVPQKGELQVQTELGFMQVSPGEIAVIPRGFVFSVTPSSSGGATGYILEVFNGHFELPELGPIGANGLANPQDFAYPTAAFDDEAGSENNSSYSVVNKYAQKFFVCDRDESPFNVVAWRGNYVPFKYDLSRFNAINSVSWDHPDPSIFTVLTCKSAVPGTALADFVIFPPRWQVSEHTFRPPYFHRNAMSEFMGLISGSYEAKREDFLPGGASLHSMMSAHGPDAQTFNSAVESELKPVKTGEGCLAFMFESSLMLGVTEWALKEAGTLQADYYKAWQGLKCVQLPKKE